jgi:iron complex outermembrane recepter protein
VSSFVSPSRSLLPSARPKLLALLILVSGSAAALDAEPLPAQSLLAANIDSVVVSGSRVATPLRETPLSIAQVQRDVIDAKQPAFTGEVLNSIAGVFMTDLGNEQHNMSIRQPLSYSPVYLYMEDGIPIRPLGLFNHNSLYEVNLDGSGSVEVIKGPASSLYGSNSVGGTINFISAAPSKDFSARIGGQASDQGYWRSDFDVSNSDGDVGGRLSGYVSRRNGGWQDFNDAQKESLSARGDWQIAADTLLKGFITYNHLRTDMPGSLFADDFKQRPEFSYNHFTYREVYATRASLVAEGDWLALGNTTLTLYARDNSTEQLPSYTIFNNSANAAAASGRHNDNDFTSLGFDARQVLNFDWLQSRVIAGATIEHTSNDYAEENLDIARDPSEHDYLSYSVRNQRRDYTVKLDNRALYTQYEITPLTDIRVVVGARYDNIEYDFDNRMTPSASTGAPSERRSFEHLSPKIGIIWSPSTEHSLFINHAQGFTPPEVSALYSSLAVPNLKESIFTNNEIGWRGAFLANALRLDITLYRLTGSDEVVNYTVTTGNTQQSEWRNAGKTLHQGIEFGADWRIDDEWQIAVAATRSRHEYRDYQISSTLDYAGNTIPAAPVWLGNTELRWQPNFIAGFSAALEWVHMSRYWLDNANTVRGGGYDLANLRLAYKISAWEIWAKAQNIADKRYAEIATSTFSGAGNYNPNTQDSYSPGAPRTLTLGFNYRYGR